MEPLLAPVLALVLSQTAALVVSAVVVLAVILLWKMLKLAFRIALIAAAGFAVYLALRYAGVL